MTAPGSAAGPVESGLATCLAQLEAHEARVRAWCWLDREGALDTARGLDGGAGVDVSASAGAGTGADAHAPGAAAAAAAAAEGAGAGAGAAYASAAASPVRGLVMGLKDIIDTADMPTENGTVLHAGRRPTRDAAVVRQLRDAGAVILGKTVTTELATYAPGVTRNPWDEQRTPGGSSSGSAAAVACGMAQAALGSQTNGSTIRPASFCGVWGFKPGRDRIARQGVLVQSPTFDTVGLFAAELGVLRSLYAALADDKPITAPQGGAPGAAPTAGWAAWWATPYWSRVDAPSQERFLAACERLGPILNPVPFGDRIPVDDIVREHQLIMEAEIARSFVDEAARGRDRLSASLQGQIERGAGTSDAQLEAARGRLADLRARVDALWPSGVEVLMLPASCGIAPVGLQHTGDPIMCTMATALDLPAVALPLSRKSGQMPLGLQLIGRRGQEWRLLEWCGRAAAGLENVRKNP